LLLMMPNEHFMIQKLGLEVFKGDCTLSSNKR
jgi:hypothetical protein